MNSSNVGSPASAGVHAVALSDPAERSVREADSAYLAHILVTMRRTLRQLEELGPVDSDLLEQNSTAGLVIERILANLREMAFDINCQVSCTHSGRPPKSFSEACEGAVGAGLIDRDLAGRLRPVDGPHHVVMQLFLDTDPDRVEAIVAGALSDFQEFEQCVLAWCGNTDVRGKGREL